MELWELLGIRPGLTAVIGSGGKTSLLRVLAQELSHRGTVLVSTTTHNMRPNWCPFAATDAALRESGFEERGGVWTRQEKEYSLTVSGQEEAMPAGMLCTMTVRVLLGEAVMAELPVARYAPEEAEQ